MQKNKDDRIFHLNQMDYALMKYFYHQSQSNIDLSERQIALGRHT